MKNQFYAGVALVALAMPAAALAQSTGSVDFDKSEIIVTAGKDGKAIAGVDQPKTSKAKAVLTKEFIRHQTPGQTINDVINYIPGVSFQNNDPFGSAGGTLTIRGFDSTRISETFDGVPLNDSGNYALYANQQLDPELIEQVNVNLGSTDVDSPTAAASGSTVNYRTRLPYDSFGINATGSLGSFNFRRIFAVVDTGEIGPWGTKAFFSASNAKNDNVYGNFGKIDKQQYNGRIYQPIGANGDFISAAVNWNVNRNNFFGSIPLRTDLVNSTGGAKVVPDRFPLTEAEREYVIARCTTNNGPSAGIASVANSCGSAFEERFNPSNTGNLRIQSKFTLADGLVLTVDPNYQYVRANGGGTVVAREGFRNLGTTLAPKNVTGYIGGAPYFGRDLNGDGDILDTIRLLAPSETNTRRYGVIASLRYDIDSNNTIRVAYSLDHAKHRQTGEVGTLNTNGSPTDVFPERIALSDGTGNLLEKRDRLSYAILNQVSGEYRGEFIDNRLVINAGVRAPFFKRDLTQNCFTTSASGNVDCFASNASAQATYAGTFPAVQGPQNRVLKYSKVLPNVGLTFDVVEHTSVFANFSQGLQVPGTDNLYQSFYFPAGTASALPKPETTNNFDFGARYKSGALQAQLSGWYTRFNNRLASAYDPILDQTVYRNLGTVNKYGVDGSISYTPIKEVSFYAFSSYLKSKIESNVQLSGGGAVDCGSTEGSVPAGCALTAGKRESGSPTYSFGGRVQGNLGPLTLGVQAKRTGPRYVNDQNLSIQQNITINGVTTNGVSVYDAKVPAYTLVDLDVRFALTAIGLNDKTYFQVNVTNLFDKLYVGGFGGGLSRTSVPFVQIGAPRAVVGSLVVGF